MYLDLSDKFSYILFNRSGNAANLAAALISSPGKYGPDQIAATWAWPLGISFGKVKKRPIVKDDLSQIVPSFYITMNFDRRVMAGAPAARFFARLIQRLEECNFI